MKPLKERDGSSGTKSNQVKKVKKDKCTREKNRKINLNSKCKLSKEFKDATVSLSNIKHRNCSGVDNWKRFLQSQGMSLTLKNTTNTTNRPVLNGNKPAGNHRKLTKAIGMDCEMVGIGEKGEDNMLARVSLVNLHGDCVYDKYVKPREKVTDYRTFVSGIRPEDIENGEEFDVVQKEVADILKNRILVGHALKNDLAVLFITHPRSATRDTAKFFSKKNRRTPSLKYLAKEYLQANIQDGEHNSIQDAQAAMHLYNLFRKQWETGKGNKYIRNIENFEVEKKSNDPVIPAIEII